jgi:dipeptide/tripeptide permease
LLVCKIRTAVFLLGKKGSLEERKTKVWIPCLCLWVCFCKCYKPVLCSLPILLLHKWQSHISSKEKKEPNRQNKENLESNVTAKHSNSFLACTESVNQVCAVFYAHILCCQKVWWPIHARKTKKETQTGGRHRVCFRCLLFLTRFWECWTAEHGHMKMSMTKDWVHKPVV